MLNRVKTLEVTKSYIVAFNNRDMAALEAMLCPDDICFVRQTQPTIVGVQPIMHRLENTFARLERQGHQLHMINAIIDVKDTKAHPCMLGILDGERFSVGILDVKANGKISNISILMTKDMLDKARPTEPLHHEEIVEMHNQKKEITEEELAERRKGLEVKAKRLMAQLEEEGPSQALLGKLDRLQEAQRKQKRMEEDLALAKMMKNDTLVKE